MKTVLLVFSLLAATTAADGVEDALDKAKNVYSDTKDIVEGNNSSTPTTNGTTDGDNDEMPGVSRQNDEVQINNNNNQNSATGSGVRCRKCTVTKNMDNVVSTVYDDVQYSAVNSLFDCTNYQCGPSEDWCLVTYAWLRAGANSQEKKVEVYTCGNKEHIRNDKNCRTMIAADNMHNLIGTCETKRSGAVTSSVSLLTIAVTLAMGLLIQHV